MQNFHNICLHYTDNHLRAYKIFYILANKTIVQHNIITLPIAVDGNYVVFAFNDASFEPRWRWMQSQASAMQARMGLNFPAFVAALNASRKQGYLRASLHQREA